MLDNNIRYTRGFKFNIGNIIFIILFIYIMFSITIYLSKERVRFYEVTEGSMVNATRYNGIILREEKVFNAETTGYINFYIRNGSRTPVGGKIYSLDETGSLATALSDKIAIGSDMDKEIVRELKQYLSDFSINYDSNKFYTVYDAKYAVDNMMLEYVNINSIDRIEQLLSETGGHYVLNSADISGVVSYTIDTYEDRNIDSVNAEDFDVSNYQLKHVNPNELIEQGAAVYKIITSDTWKLVFPLTDEDKSELEDRTSLDIIIRGKEMKFTGDFSIITGSDNKEYGCLTFDKYMIQIVDDRMVEFEIDSNNAKGLKIPHKAVLDKTFYTVPIDYIAQDEDTMEKGFYKEVYNEQGSDKEFIPTEIYYETEEYFYISNSPNNALKEGDYIVKPESQDRYQIGNQASLQGVYSINKGYALFKQIEIISSNQEYYIIKKNTNYGLSVYDRILLNIEGISEGDFMYQ